MPRGRKPKVHLTIDEQIAAVENQIAECQRDIANLKQKKKDLLASKDKVELEALYAALKEKGMTPAEAISKITE